MGCDRIHDASPAYSDGSRARGSYRQTASSQSASRWTPPVGVSGCVRSTAPLHAMPVARSELQGRAPLINIQASPWDPTLSRAEYRVRGTARHEHALSVSGIPIHPALETGAASDTDPGSNHLTSRPIPHFWRSIRPFIPWFGPWVGPWAGRPRDVTREALPSSGSAGPWWMNYEDGKLPSVLNQKPTVTVPHRMYCTVTGIDFNSPHSHANGFPAQHTGLPSCFCSGRRFSCMQLKKAVISLLPALSASACPTNMGVCPSTTSHPAPHPAPAEFPLPGLDGTPRVSRPKYSFWLSPSRNGLAIGSPAEAIALPTMYTSSLPCRDCLALVGVYVCQSSTTFLMGFIPQSMQFAALQTGYSEALRGLDARSTTVGVLLHRPGIGTTGPLALLTFGRRVTDFPPCRKAHASALHVSQKVA